ncbi:hypothetical protein WJX73_010484 [Symbiochloris irregularis]|uniref:Uncharacterized protein n=1 Tax=Symbiochloris irregularis TaxID=706552 RepID=A0AAW1P1Q8_9CHLO
MQAGVAGVGQAGEREICSEVLRVESKLFFLDARINDRGAYLKISEKSNSRSRSTVVVPAAGIAWFRELFKYYSGATDAQGPLVSKECPVESKVFFFELGENARGQFLRVSESGAGPRGRSSLIVPSGGPDFAGFEAMRGVLERVEAAVLQSLGQAIPGHTAALQQQVQVSGPAPVVGPGPTPPTVAETEFGGQVVRAGHKRYFFDPGSNQKGSFVRITEVVGADRISLMVPMEAAPQFIAALDACMQQHLAEQPASSSFPAS